MIKIFSGIRPSGKLHLGNYLGAIKNWLALSEAEGIDQTIFAVVDLHGITTPYDPKKCPDQVMDTVCDYLAAGVDPDKSLLIRQSHVPQHTELAWLFNTITPVSWLDRLPTYKEKLEQAPKYHNMGLLDYPVLMAADILLYKSTLVPVGEDQLPHIDLTNEIAKRFNSAFGDTFEPVKPYMAEGARIMSLQEPTKKMSKTGDDGIALSDNPDTIREKIKKAATDSGKEIQFDEKAKPGISNLLTIYSLLSGQKISALESQYAGTSYSKFKNDLAEVVVNFLKPHQDKYNDLRANPDKVLKTLESSEEKARQIANKNMREIKSKMGLF